MEVIKIEEVLKVCDEFNADPSKEHLTALEEMQNKLVVKSYLSTENKVIALHKMVMDSDRNVDIPPAVFTIALELACLFDGLLAYTNIDQNIDRNLKTYENYDSIYQSGLADYILQYCFRDYDRLVRLMERSLSFENLMELMRSLEGIDTKSMDEAIRKFNDFKENTDPAMLKDISDIIRYNDPTLYDLKTNVIDDILDKLDRMDRLEKNGENHEEN